MAASIRGHQTSVRLFKAGQLQNEIQSITSFEVNQDTDFSRSNYLGQKLPEGDQVQQGWSGSLDMEVKNSGVDTFIDGLVDQNLAGVGIDESTIVDTENYSDGTSSAYVYFDCQWKMSKSQPAQTDKVTKRLEFQAASRLKL